MFDTRRLVGISAALVMVFALAGMPTTGACETTPMVISSAAGGGTTLVVGITNPSPNVESGSLWIDFTTASHGASQLVHTIMDLGPGETEIVTIEFYESYLLTGFALCGDVPAISEAPEPIDISTKRNAPPPKD